MAITLGEVLKSKFATPNNFIFLHNFDIYMCINLFTKISTRKITKPNTQETASWLVRNEELQTYAFHFPHAPLSVRPSVTTREQLEYS
jgi:hypothetical protein